jgi:hypothetical protein
MLKAALNAARSAPPSLKPPVWVKLPPPLSELTTCV